MEYTDAYGSTGPQTSTIGILQIKRLCLVDLAIPGHTPLLDCPQSSLWVVAWQSIMTG
ncbi:MULTISPECIES: hypothetical protein [Ktedonobacter]|uniref:hypothetical protein n=1 Tax=Ktedonobacter TaxID=363276 RepID=UPI0012FBAF5C|nr:MULTISPECIES: hypothetical protein [Ktedonobacter]